MTFDITWLELFIAVAATVRLTRLFVDEDFPPIATARAWLLARYPTTDDVFFPTEVHPYCDQPLADLIHSETNDLEELEAAGWPDTAPFVTTTRYGTPVTLNVDTDDEIDASWSPSSDHPIGQLITCPWCLGFWISLAVTVGLAAAPTLTVWVTLPFAFNLAAGSLTRRL